jgi:hypothetical protein
VAGRFHRNGDPVQRTASTRAKHAKKAKSIARWAPITNLSLLAKLTEEPQWDFRVIAI